MKKMDDAGTKTVIKYEQTSVVWDMLGAAFSLGCGNYVLPLEEVADRI